MYCPRLDHFARLNADGTLGRCGHMTTVKGFGSFESMSNSAWLTEKKNQMQRNEWPDECHRCQQSEEMTGESVRTKSIERHKLFLPVKEDYLIVGGVLDNVCNSACQTCSSQLSTKIGSLEFKNYPKVDNFSKFWEIPQNRILEVDVNGGEPTASKNYKKLLTDLPPNTKIVRMNTNCSRIIPELEDVLKKNIMVIVTISLDGIGKVHDYVRWPIKWDKFTQTVNTYKEMQSNYKLLQLDFWTTVSCLNIKQLPDILNYAKNKKIPHAWALLNNPDVLNVKYSNPFTEAASSYAPNTIAVERDNTEELFSFMTRQDTLRGIEHRDYFNLDLNLDKNK